MFAHCTHMYGPAIPLSVAVHFWHMWGELSLAQTSIIIALSQLLKVVGLLSSCLSAKKNLKEITDIKASYRCICKG